MSKSVRLKDYLASEVEKRADDENRSFANMVERLLEQALGLRGIVIETDAPEDIIGILASPTKPPRDAREEPSPSATRRFGESKPASYFPEREFKPDFGEKLKKGEK